jgi:hypothetical protein
MADAGVHYYALKLYSIQLYDYELGCMWFNQPLMFKEQAVCTITATATTDFVPPLA